MVRSFQLSFVKGKTVHKLAVALFVKSSRKPYTLEMVIAGGKWEPAVPFM